MKKSSPKTIKAMIPVHCAHSGFMETSKLVPNPLNPKKHGPRKLALYAKIIRESGWRGAIVVSNPL
jgi:hypothetical protein